MQVGLKRLAGSLTRMEPRIKKHSRTVGKTTAKKDSGKDHEKNQNKQPKNQQQGSLSKGKKASLTDQPSEKGTMDRGENENVKWWKIMITEGWTRAIRNIAKKGRADQYRHILETNIKNLTNEHKQEEKKPNTNETKKQTRTERKPKKGTDEQRKKKCIKTTALTMITTIIIWAFLVMMKAGDIETNPGPTNKRRQDGEKKEWGQQEAQQNKETETAFIRSGVLGVAIMLPLLLSLLGLHSCGL